MIDHDFEELVESIKQLSEILDCDEFVIPELRDELESRLCDEIRDLSDAYGLTEQEILEL